MFYKSYRKMKISEMIIIVLGLAVMLIGFVFLREMYLTDPQLSWNMVLAIFVYLLVLVGFLIAAICMDVKEEVTLILHENLLESRLHRDATQEHIKHTKKLSEWIKK